MVIGGFPLYIFSNAVSSLQNSEFQSTNLDDKERKRKRERKKERVGRREKHTAKEGD